MCIRDRANLVQQGVGRRRIVGPLRQVGRQQGVVGGHEGVHDRRPAAPETYFADIKQGDYVVHLDYGIGKFEGLVVRNLGGMEREYLLVQYANGDTLYVPCLLYTSRCV